MKKFWDEIAEKERSEKVFLFAMAALLFFGLLLRTRHFLAGRSLWLDEAMLALNIRQLSFGALTQQPLPYEQGAPIGFLFFIKTTVLLLGDSEYSFRLFSFLTGSFSVLLLAYFAAKYLEKAGALFALALFACAPMAIYYSAETKQYMGDLFAVLFIYGLYLWLLNGAYTHRKMAVFTLLASVLLWFSHASVFGVAAVALSLLWHYFQRQDRPAFFGSFLGMSVAGMNAILVYWWNIRPLADNAFLASFWNEAYMPLPPTFSWVSGVMRGWLQRPLSLQIPVGLAYLLIFLGIFRLWQKARPFALPLLLTLLLTLIAGALQKYPLAERMLLFWLPLIFLLFGAALDALNEFIRPCGVKVLVLAVLVGYILLFPAREAFARFQKPLTREHIRPAMSYLLENYQEDDRLYLYYFSEPAYLFYAPKYGLDDLDYVVGENRQGTPDLYKSDLDALDMHGRVWFLFSHVYEDATLNEEDYVNAYLKQVAEQKRFFRYPGSSVTLYLYFFP